MTKPIISFENVSKVYRIGEWHSLSKSIKGVLLRQRPVKQYKQVLEDVSFQIEQGTSVGLVGRNGAGKTTLLRLLAGITLPSAGHIQVRGRLAALIALGAGFNNELTGRENIYLNATMLGLSRSQVNRRLDEIIDFAEIGEYIDTPIKRYSSGMNARLAFSIYAHVSADIVLIDEVLSVGDLRFQLKCQRFFSQYRQRGGTMFLVSHNLQLIRNVTAQSIWLENGQAFMNGPSQDVCDAYESKEVASSAAGSAHYEQGGRRVHYDPDVEVTEVEFMTREGIRQQIFQFGESMSVRVKYRAKREVKNPIFVISAFTPEDLSIFGLYSSRSGYEIGPLNDEGYIFLHLDNMNLSVGNYRLSISLSEDDIGNILDWHEKMYTWVVVGSRISYGLLTPNAEWQHVLSTEAKDRRHQVTGTSS